MAVPALLGALLPGLATAGEKIAAHFFPDPADKLKADELRQRLPAIVLESVGDVDKIAGDIIKTEAGSGSFLAANWRPITALVFVGLIVARWFGWTAPGMTEGEYLSVYELVKIMIGGYVASRGIEKVAPAILEALKK